MPNKKKNQTKDKEIVEIFKKFDEMQGEIVTKLEDVYQKGNITYFDVEAYLTNQNHFTGTQWGFLNKEREILINKIWKSLGKKTKSKHDKKIQDKTASQRKRKTLGGRKKWIPMR